MRTRKIKPNFRDSESMGNVCRDARLLFVLMITIADDEGRLRGNHRYLAHTLFPHDSDAEQQIGAWLKALEHEECIRQYQLDGTPYIAFVNWKKHQPVDHPKASKIDPPPKLGQVRLPLPEVSEEPPRQRH